MNKQILAKLQSGKSIVFTIESLQKITLKQAVMAIIVQDEILDLPGIRYENNIVYIDFTPEDEAAIVALIYASDLCVQKTDKIQNARGECVRLECYADKIIRLFEQFNALHLDSTSIIIDYVCEHIQSRSNFGSGLAMYALQRHSLKQPIVITEDHLRDMTLSDMFILFRLETDIDYTGSDGEFSSNIVLSDKPNIVKCKVRYPWVVTMFLTTWIDMSNEEYDNRIKIAGKKYNLKQCCPGFVEIVTGYMIENGFLGLKPCEFLLTNLYDNSKIPDWDKLIRDELKQN